MPELTATIQTVAPTAIIWAAGAGGGNPERTESVDHLSAIKACDAAAAAGVTRFITISALDVRDKSKPEPEWYSDADRAMSEQVWGAIGAYMAAKLAADRDLVGGNGRRGLEWTIVRPGGLSDESGTGKVEAGRTGLGRMVSREDVAAVVKCCLEDEGTVGLAFDVVGGEVPIKEAVAKVVEERVDTFKGRF